MLGLLRDTRIAAAGFAGLSAAILATALASQFLGGLAPCQLCLYQRWPYVAVMVLGGLAATAIPRGGVRRGLIALCGLAFLVGGGIAFYHVGVEQGWFAGPSSCSGVAIQADSIDELRRQLMAAPIVRCDEVPWSLFGISLAGFNLIASIVLAGAGLYAAAKPGKTA